MKQRITFILPPKENPADDAFRLTKDSLEIKDLTAIREDRFTVGFQELPQFLKDVVKQTHELYIRFDNGKDYADKRSGPFASRLPLGVHIFAVPLRESKMGNLCSFLSKYADIPCNSIEESFTKHKRSKQFYSPDPAVLSRVLKPLANKVCGPAKKACKEKLMELETASSVDVKYDVVSQVLEVNALWNSYSGGNRQDGHWDLLIKPNTPGDRVEIGILTDGDSAQREEISLQGQVGVVGQDDKLKPTLITFPARHHGRSNIYMAGFNQPTGLHPKLEVTLALGGSSPAEECTLNAYFTVPQPFFVDPYQLEDVKLMQSYGIKKVRVVEGETDLEAPAWAMTKWGALVLAELDVKEYMKRWAEDPAPMEITLPLHLRYLPTHPEKWKETATLPWPTVFWACHSEDWSKMTTNPFDRRMLGYEDYFPEQTFFYHLTPKLINTTLSQSSLEVPILNSVDAQLIEWGTMGIIVVGFVWVFGKIVFSLLGAYAPNVEEHKKKE
ncbi:hypothetical protein H072_8657 [Dactylellina haptotyla CBS 200.50]|uniref:Protein PBN1 n=1 Tax=Dactylellina haptotyla (strain CBS 200.50) TaxID=1284197 RepID=S8A3L4_DACHA|nr:hypothetical protein H072_8657 [Dactylellina haptotyla CBS 200.50]